MNNRIIALSGIALAGCGDATLDGETQNIGYDQTEIVSSKQPPNEWSKIEKIETKVTSNLKLSDILLKENWEVLDTTAWIDGMTTTEYCISWKFLHPKSFMTKQVGSFTLKKGSVEQQENDSYIYDCSRELITYKLYFTDNESDKKHLISTITRISQASASTTRPASDQTPTPTSTPNSTASYGTFIIKMRVGINSSIDRIGTKTYAYDNIWLGSLDKLGTQHTNELTKSGTTYTWDLTQDNSNCGILDTLEGLYFSCNLLCYSTTGNTINRIVSLAAKYFPLTTCKDYSDRAVDLLR